MIEADYVRLALGPLFLIGLLLIMRSRKREAGRLLMLIGVLHILGGVWVGRAPLARIFRDGFFGEAESALGHLASHMDKELVFWFLLWGVFTFILGQVISSAEGQGRRTPAVIGWELAAVTLLTIALYPKGGFWFVLIPAFLIIKGSKQSVD